MKLPKGLTSLEGFSFTEEQVENNRLWKLEGNEFFLHTCRKPHTSIVANYRGKDVIDFEFNYLKKKSIALLTEYFLRKGKLTSVQFSGDLEDLSDMELIPQLRRNAIKKTLTFEEIEKGCSNLKHLLEEYCYEINWFTVVVHIGNHFREVKINSASTFGVIGSEIEGIEEELMSLILETIQVLGGQKGQKFNPIVLPLHEKVKHPLARSIEVLNKFYQVAGEDVRLELGMPKEEWDLIKANLTKHAGIGEETVLYRHEADRLIKGLII